MAGFIDMLKEKFLIFEMKIDFCKFENVITL